jgi:hypothetical protein
MTHAEIYLQIAVKALNEGKLTGKSMEFIESIKNYDKKALKRLTSNQFSFLRDIAKQQGKK